MVLLSSSLILVLLAVAVHQLFRTRETYRISAHLALLLGPPTLLVIFDGYLTALLPTSSSLFLYYTTYLSALVASVVFYRISPFHPLWRYPGPFWCRTTMFWHAAVAATGEQPRYIQRLHEKYGDIVRFGPNNLSIRDSSLVGPLMGSSGVGKGPNFIGAMLTETNIPMVGIMDSDEHIRRRRAWTRGLGPAALKEFEHLIVRRAQQLVDRLGEQEGVVNIGKWINYFSYDLMSDMTFGGGSELLQEGDQTNVWRVIYEADTPLSPATFLAQVPWLGLYVAHIPAAVKALDTFLQLGKEFAMRRIKKGSTTPDLFHYLTNEDLPDKPQPPLQQLVDDGILAIVAGADTVSSAMTSLFHCLLTHPETYRKLQEEVDKYYPQGEDAFNSKHYRDMVYLQAVIHEAIRLYPPIMTSSPRKVPNGAGVAVGSLYLPPGTSIMIPPFSLHRDARNFTFPDSFWPERWLVAAGELALADAPLPRPIPSLSFESSPSRKFPSDTLLPTLTSHSAHTLAESEFVHNDSAFLAFSHGPLNCVGKGLGMQEMRTVVTAIMQRYEMRLREGWDAAGYEAAYRDYFVSTRPEVPVLLERRGRVAAWSRCSKVL
ncbi:high nitrogen upregulated cytochrome P450 monooxygenase 2 [Lentinus tigrinus ALCF2SS1-7]|uniref:high nitrogen upregulated cytochrome P450 monooxygenase 2 n=1 Tax=Lentinus tigrinus ALCF2SS1-7 TaxID=1328758 RepID=UPI001166333C|nr:high nitrogen upregulated cytochrome P450 monooxygenase 2 [Lentinus tigrinus ALCF2SS1-7]